MDNPFRRGILKPDINTPNGKHNEWVQEFLTYIFQERIKE